MSGRERFKVHVLGRFRLLRGGTAAVAELGGSDAGRGSAFEG